LHASECLVGPVLNSWQLVQYCLGPMQGFDEEELDFMVVVVKDCLWSCYGGCVVDVGV
jgi:hypothetical protein